MSDWTPQIKAGGRRMTVLVITLQALLLATSVSMALSMRVPVGLIACVAAIFVAAAFQIIPGRWTRAALIVCWISSVTVWAWLLLAGQRWFVPDAYHLLISGMIVAATTLGALEVSERVVRNRWLFLAWTWALLACLGWIATAYLLNLFAGFHAALVLTVLVLLGCRLLFRPRALVIQVLHTCMLLLIALPLVDAVLRPDYHFDERPATARRHYSYEAARKDPNAFARWWRYSIHQWSALARQIIQPDPTGLLPHSLRPGVSARFFESEVSINSLGFRGPEIEREKGNVYRIVALGESTTFGVTMGEQDVPWPRLLERMIRERLEPDRPVEVINAGFPGHDLKLNLRRLEAHILPLEPDMIISYHGYNGFRMLDDSLPPVIGKTPPRYQMRPLKLLADAEYRMKVMRYRREHAPPAEPSEPPRVDLMENEYGDAYRQLIRIANENGIRLVLANYSMAVNASSDPDVIAFYRTIFPTVYRQIQANALHSRMIEQLCRDHPGIQCIDTLPVLDGRHEKFTDVMHHTPEGREALAEAIFRGLEETLKEELAPAK